MVLALPSPLVAGYRFLPEVILLAVRGYLSYRDVEELLAERGIEVDHVTIYRWGPTLHTNTDRRGPAMATRGR
jgi:transposase-like protein